MPSNGRGERLMATALESGVSGVMTDSTDEPETSTSVWAAACCERVERPVVIVVGDAGELARCCEREPVEGRDADLAGTTGAIRGRRRS